MGGLENTDTDVEGKSQRTGVVIGVALAVVVAGIAAAVAVSGDSHSRQVGNDQVVTPPHLAAIPVSCTEDSSGPCSIVVADALALVTDGATFTETPAGATVVGDMTIPTGDGDVELDDAELEIETDEEGEIADITGTADTPLPTTGPFAESAIIDGARVEVGYDWGRNLADLGAHLQPDRQYFYFRVTDTFAMRTGFDELFGEAAGLPIELSTPFDASATIVLDPADPYFYIGGACPDFGTSDSSDNDGDNRNNSDDAGEGDRADLTVGAEAGEDCGLGVSYEGNIPFTAAYDTGATDEQASFNGHMVIDHSEIPLTTGVVLDGTMVVELGSRQISMGGNGVVLATVPLVDKVVDLSLPFGDASSSHSVAVGASASQTSADVFLGGILDSDRGLRDLPDWLPIEPAADTTLEAAARIVTGPPGQPLGPDSFIEVVGQMGPSSSFLTELTGVSISPIQSSDALLQINSTGMRLAGTTSASIHPAISAGGEMTLNMTVPPTDLKAAVVELVGQASIAEVELEGDTRFRLSSAGLEAGGAVSTPLSVIDLTGTISDTAIDLRGNVIYEAAVPSVDGLLDGVPQAVDEASQAVTAIDAEIEATRSQVIAEREQALNAARAGVDTSKAVVDRIDRSLTSARNDLDDARDDLDDVFNDILDLCPFCTKVSQVAESLIPKRLKDARSRLRNLISDLEDEIDDLTDDRRAADAVYDGAISGLNELEQEYLDVAVDADPRIIALLAARESLTLALDGAEGVAGILNPDAQLTLDIGVVLGLEGLGGDVTGRACSDAGCLDVAGGEVLFSPIPQACFTVAGADACIEF